MVRERIEGRLRRGENFDVESLEERAGAKLRTRQTLRDVVVDSVGRLRRQALAYAEDALEGMGKPQPRRRTSEEVPVRRQDVPDLARVGLDRTAVEAPDTERFERDTLAVEHPEDVMVRNDEKRRGVRKWLIAREPCGVGVTVRTDDRQPGDFGIEAARYGANRRLRRKQAIGMDMDLGRHRF